MDTKKQDKVLPHIKDLKNIRILIDQGRGYGHQKAGITLMKKLREIGFAGEFDILYNESYPEAWKHYENKKLGGGNGRKIEILIDGFKAKPIYEEDNGSYIKNKELGKIKITRISNKNEDTLGKLEETDLCFCAGSELNFLFYKKKPKQYVCKNFIQLQPTDWFLGAGRFVVDENEKLDNIDNKVRLSAKPNNKQFNKNEFELKIENLAKNSNSQLLYSLYPNKEIEYEWDTRMGCEIAKQKDAPNLDPKILLERLISAHLKIKQYTPHQPTVLFCPQGIILDKELQKYLLEKFKDKLEFADLTKNDINLDQKKDKIIIGFTGALREPFFEEMLLKKTKFPPVIEGCNSIETCESNGRPFIHSTETRPVGALIKYKVEDVQSHSTHNLASECLRLEDTEAYHSARLEEYMLKSVNPNSKIQEYHKQRQAEFLKRPDAVETALNIVGIGFDKHCKIQTKQNIIP